MNNIPPPSVIQGKKVNAELRAQFYKTLDDAKKNSIAQKWIETNNNDNDALNISENDKQLSMCVADPDLGWEMILRISELTENKICLSRLGCWHLEGYLARHGELVIDRIEKAAKQNKIVQRLLACVYENTIPPNVYAKVKSLSLRDGFFDD